MSSKRMPIQAPLWTEFLSCPICHNDFTGIQRLPISLGCGHTICRVCLGKAHNWECPFDLTPLKTDLVNLPVNTALLQLLSNGTDSRQSNNFKTGSDHSKSRRNFKSGYVNGSTTDGVDSMLSQTPPSVQNLSSQDLEYYKTAKECIENLAIHLRSFVSNNGGSLLSRPMQRKLVTLITCQLMEEEGRLRALKAAHSLGERTITELIYQHQNPQQLSTNLWASVRSRGCQFLGPSMQEEILKLILMALEGGKSLSRKVLIAFVVEQLEPHFSQISKSSIGHVIQLLYRASCFKVEKCEGVSSVMQLKEEFRTFDALRQEHDTQIVQIATEAGLRISPEQWSSLLYGDALHKIYMMNIIEKIQTLSSVEKSIQELNFAVQRNGDSSQIESLCAHLKDLANVNPTTLENAAALTWEQLATALKALCQIINGFIEFTHHHGNRKQPDSTGGGQRFNPNTKYKISFCRDYANRRICPRGTSCTFAHSEDELERHRAKSRKNGKNPIMNGGTNVGGPMLPGGSSSPSKKETYHQPQYEHHAGHHSPALLNSSDELNTPVSSSAMPYTVPDVRNKTYSRTFYPSMDYTNDVSTNMPAQFGSMSLADTRNHHPIYHKPISPIHNPYLDESAHAPMAIPAHNVGGGQYHYHESKPYGYMGYGAFPPHMMPPNIQNNYHPNVSMGVDASGNVVLLMPYPYPYPFQHPNMAQGPPVIPHHHHQNQVAMNNNNVDHINNMDSVEND